MCLCTITLKTSFLHSIIFLKFKFSFVFRLISSLNLNQKLHYQYDASWRLFVFCNCRVKRSHSIIYSGFLMAIGLNLSSRHGITGLETAIILIAFIIVAAVFAFAILRMGLITVERAKSTVSAGMKQAASALQLAGSVIAYGDPYTGIVSKIEICIRLAPGNEPIDTRKGNLTISYMNKRIYVSNVYDGTKAYIEWVTGDGDDLLEFGEVAKIVINLDAIGTDATLKANEWFKVEIKPPVGSILTIERTIPPAIDPVMDLG